MKTLLFAREDISRIVAAVGFDRLMDDTICGLSEACNGFDSEAHSIPVRSGFSYNDEDSKGLVEWMPVIRYGDRVVIKLVGYHPDNPKKFRLPTVISTIMTFDTRTGHATNIVDGTFLTSLRTGAASAVASMVLAKPDSRVLGLIGAGAQSVTQLHAISRRFDLGEVLIFDTDVSACTTFADRAACAGVELPIEVLPMQEVLSAADILCTSTSIDVGCGPLFEDQAFVPGLHINAVGSDFPGKIELPLALLERSLVCPDFRAQAIAEGECQQLGENDIGPELTELVKEHDKYADYRDRTTVFDSTGWALEDLVMADIMTSLGDEIGVGRSIELECVGQDPKNPYGFIASQSKGLETLLSNVEHWA